MSNPKSKSNSASRSSNGRSRTPKPGKPVKEASTPANTIRGNEPEWYIYNQKMFEGVISMPTIEFKGRPIPMLTSEADNYDIEPQSLYVPDVLVYNMNPSAGVNSEGPYSASSPLNIAARKMYAEWSASNAKTSQYAPEDIAMCILSIGQIIAMITHAKRLYGIVNYFSFYNRSIPESICTSLGMDYDNIRNNLSDMRNRINQLIARLDTIQFPSEFDHFKKCEYIYANVFVDREDRMPTYHLMAPYSTWILDETGSSKGTQLKTVPIVGVVDEYGTLVDIIEQMLDQVLYSATFNFIYADIINLINRNVLKPTNIHIDMLPIDHIVTPLYSEQFNWQVKNMTIMGAPLATPIGQLNSTPDNDVQCDTEKSSIYYNPRFGEYAQESAVPIRGQSLNIPIRITDTDISPKDLLELTVYYNVKKLVNYGGSAGINVLASSLSDYYCVDMKISSGGNLNRADVGTISNNYLHVTDIWADSTLMTILQTSHIPFLAFLRANGNKVQFMPTVRLGTFTQLSERVMKNLRYQVYLGLFSMQKDKNKD